MRRALAGAVLAGAVLAGLALAAPARAQTILHLTETASVTARPDELAASLRAEAVTATPAEAQQEVNGRIADALSRARQVAGVTASTGLYTVWRTGPTPQDRTERWQASQTLELHGRDAAPLLQLVGELQQRGLATGRLGWRLSEQAGRTARRQALEAAVKALRGRAEAAAALLDLQFDAFREVRLDAPSPPPPFLRAMIAAAPATPPPSAEAEDVAVSATAEADVLLKPR